MAAIDRSIHQLASSQHGVFSRTQARAVGVSSKALASRLRSGALTALSPEVMAVAGAPATDLFGATAAVLDVRGEAALSHHSSGAYWKLPGCRLRPFEVSAVRRHRTSTTPLGIVHTTTLLPSSHVTVIDGLRVTVPVRVLFDLAGRVHPDRLARLIDAAWRLHLVTGRLLRRTLLELEGRGRPGIQVMRDLIDERGDDYRPTDSNLEARFEQIMASIGIRSLVRQVDAGAIDWAGRVDFLDRDLALIIEIDSETYHLSLTDQADDERRRKALTEAGFTIVSVRGFDVWHRPEIVKRQVIDARRRACLQQNLSLNKAGSVDRKGQVRV